MRMSCLQRICGFSAPLFFWTGVALLVTGCGGAHPDSTGAAGSGGQAGREAGGPGPGTGPGSFDVYGGRVWEKLAPPGATCGDGTPFWAYYSPATDAAGKNRLVVYFNGGGSTSYLPSGELQTPVKNLANYSRLRQYDLDPARIGGDRLFMNNPANAEFIGTAHWLLIPYCTQDRHLGRRTTPAVYDLTNAPGVIVRQQLQTKLDAGQSVSSIEAKYPALDISVDTAGKITRVTLSILHRGALNVQAALIALDKRLASEDTTLPDRGEVLVSGGSAGGFGAWFNLWRFADPLYGHAGSRASLVPMGGGPTAMVYDASTHRLVPGGRDTIIGYFKAYDGLYPCRVSGAAHTATGKEDCVDGLDLLDHYIARYAGMDLRVMPIFNKMDMILMSGLISRYSGNQLHDAILNTCQTNHRYAQRLAEKPGTTPVALWQFRDQSWSSSLFGGYKPEHVPDHATILTHVLEPGPGPGDNPSHRMLLGMINGLAARSWPAAGQTQFIEHQPYVVRKPNAYPPAGLPTQDPLPAIASSYAACNVPLPL